jgi:hypothetical protein
LAYLGVDGRIISERVLGKYGGKVWIGFIWLRIGTNDRFSCTRYEHSGSIKGM